ncbi:hypothetical protein [Methyloversatilis universalis]|uniref:hypothetical protein n=1 Tax=Methyloversatilis universalis TaxID=378211 RepID=UPI001111D1B2|nr:hypothetical protein [Methyloversatilis universalis]
MSAHTPGPWVAKRMRNDHGNFDIDSDSGFFVAETIGGLDDGKEEANARLIAAAPDQNAALLHADGCFQAALFEGWIDALADGDIDRIRDIWSRRLSCAFELIPAAIEKAGGAA